MNASSLTRQAVWIVLGASAILTFLCTTVGCQPVEIGRTKPWWEEIEFENEGNQFGAQEATSNDESSSIDDAEGQTENADGTITLLAPLPEYLVNHLHAALIDQDYDLIMKQLVAFEAVELYKMQGRDPNEITQWLAANRRDVVQMLLRMNRGFNSTGVVWEKSGDTYRMKLTGRTAQGMRFTILDLTRENGDFKMVLIK